jgi:hypothetical protein
MFCANFEALPLLHTLRLQHNKIACIDGLRGLPSHAITVLLWGNPIASDFPAAEALRLFPQAKFILAEM